MLYKILIKNLETLFEQKIDWIALKIENFLGLLIHPYKESFRKLLSCTA